MDTKSKNKRFAVPVLIVMIVSISLALLTMTDLYHKRENLQEDNYFQSPGFNRELETFADLVKKVHVDYADYTPGKLDEKTANELKKEHEDNLKSIQKDNAEEFSSRIRQATEDGNTDEVNRLKVEQKNSLQEQTAHEVDSWQERVKQAIADKDTAYEEQKNSLTLRSGSYRFYVTDKKNDRVYTNLGHYPSDDELNRHARFWINIPDTSPNPHGAVENISRTYQLNELSGIFYVPYSPDGYSQVHADALYYDSIRDRLIAEFVLLGGTLLILALCYWYLPASKALEVPLVAKSLALFRLIPLDIRMALLFVLGMIYLVMLASVRFFFLPVDGEHFFTLAFVSLFTAYLLLQFMEAWLMYNQPERFTQQWQKSICARQRVLLQESYANRGMFFKVSTLFILTVMFGISIVFAFVALFAGSGGLLILSFLYGMFYMVVVFPYTLRRLGLMNRIMHGASEMAGGNLNATIQKVQRGKLSDLAHSLNNITKGLKHAMEEQMKSERMKSELITNVSHDLKTPLTSIINYVNLLKQENLTPEERKSYVDVLDRKADRLRVLIDDLFDAAKMSSGAVELNIEQVNVASLLNQSIAEFSDKIEQSTLTFRVTTEQPKIVAPLDGKKTWRVFENLIGNALKYSMPNTRVLIHLAETQDEVILTFKNVSAYEIDFDAQELFERFKRADQSRHTEGSGLGLAIAKSIVELQGGKLSIDIDGDYFKVMVVFRKHA
ncbi:GHKL domain-containing protein [Brevibacillus antibioticus]|uniref:histidine kinase n=1 Tax=Brevibacillus antibioticus TaxID=2570228 RepID=A0A4U2YC33_9BACL|nr:histidine kinase dimerization/phospho-acceptor domain-containing protein [Brevibacillus antibioticus]TKI58338.1 GHKL domain-containing protein [Brevibacillus antibioticus]